VYRELTGDPEMVLALEFMDDADFWGLEFPAGGSGDLEKDPSGQTRLKRQRRKPATEK
jgi:hypothetical protein